MPIVEIITGAAGAGKSELCRAHLLERPGTWLLLPSEERCARWRQLLPGRAASFRTLPGLARERDGASGDDREVVTPAFRLLILRQLVREHVRPGDYFGKVAGTAGFIRRLADLRSQLKQSEAGAEALAAAVQAASPHAANPAFARKGEEIAALQRHYDDYLQAHRLCDPEDLMTRAIARIQEAADSPGVVWPPLLLVDGFAAFTPLQLSFLQALPTRVPRLVITLTHDSSRPVLFARSAETLARLRDRFPAAVVTELPPGPRHAVAPGLRLLEQQLFRGEAPAPAVDESVRVFAAPDELMQVEMVAREIRRLIDRNGYRPREIGLLARSVADLAPVIKSVFGRYDIPVWLHIGERLGANPFVACIAALLRVWLRDWRRDDLLRFLRSSFLGLNRFALGALEGKARGLGLQHGRSRWLAAAGEPGAPLTQLLQRLAGWQDRCSATRAPAEFCAALSQALIDLGLIATPAAETGESPRTAPRAVEDACAWESARNILDDLSRLEPLPAGGPWRYEGFAEAAMAGWAEGFYNLPANNEDRVQVMEVYDLRGHQFRAAFVLDLIEGVFPRQPREDPFFRDDERQMLACHGSVTLPLSVAQADEERLLFYQAVTTPGERLVLCYPETDGGRPTLPSFFLDEAGQALTLPPAQSLSLADAVPDPAEAVLPGERLAFLAAALGDGEQPEDDRAPEPLRRLCAALREEQPERLARLLSARDARRPYHLSHPALRSRWHGRRGTCTVSELETVLACPFQHFLSYRLRIGGAVDGAGPLDQGQILHEALRRFFSEVRASGFPEPEPALDRLRALCRERFEETPLDGRPYRIRLAEGALLRYLEGFLQREISYRQASRMDLAHLELAFGPQCGAADAPEDGALLSTDGEPRGPTDPASTPQPLVVRSGDAEVRLSGKIDRIDRTPDGYALVLDYKLGKARTLKQIQEGESLQMPVYWLAVEQLLGLTPVGGAYDAMREGQRPIIARCDLADHAFSHKGILGKNALGKVPFEQLLDQARGSIVEAAALIERLEVAPAPREAATCSYCSYQDCCRPEEANIHFDRQTEEQPADD